MIIFESLLTNFNARIVFETARAVSKIGLSQKRTTGGPRYMREIGTPIIDSNIMNSHIKRPRMTVN